MRLDLYLSQNGYCSSRTEAKALITAGAVSVEGAIITKPSFDISDGGVAVSVDLSSRQYVSRGGIKLAAALTAFDVSVDGKLCVDIGASSGGFTDCLLQHGASRVVAIDSGSGQMTESLKRDERVRVVENYNARYLNAADIGFSPDIAVMDVSFISATSIIPPLSLCLEPGADFILLIKPQFEVGRANVGKGGIVRDSSVRRMAVERVTECAASNGFSNLAVIESPIRGGDGNLEFLAHFRKM